MHIFVLSLQVNTGVAGATKCVQAPSGNLYEPIAFPEDVAKDSDVYPLEVAPPLKIISPEE